MDKIKDIDILYKLRCVTDTEPSVLNMSMAINKGRDPVTGDERWLNKDTVKHIIAKYPHLKDVPHEDIFKKYVNHKDELMYRGINRPEMLNEEKINHIKKVYNHLSDVEPSDLYLYVNKDLTLKKAG